MQTGSIEISDALWQANPDNVEVGRGLGTALSNLGLLLEGVAGQVYDRSIEIRKALWQANPDNVEIIVEYAGSLCAVGRWHEAEWLVFDVLALMPEHPYARQLADYIESQRSELRRPALIRASSMAATIKRWPL